LTGARSGPAAHTADGPASPPASAPTTGSPPTIAEVLRDAGAIAVPGALDTRGCARLIAEMLRMTGAETRPISPETMEREHDPEFVRSRTLVPSAAAQATVERAIALQLPGLTGFFGRALELNPELHFLTYGAGGFIRPHRDVLEGDHVLEKIRERVVVFTLFLNGAEGPGAHRFGGGDFVLHPDAERRLVIPSVPGMLLAFRAEVVHSVREVRSGARHAVSGWLRAPRETV
jgi:predicted 2-oxoglutarate/Fe(II)-dependent dioxygenase YbiX